MTFLDTLWEKEQKKFDTKWAKAEEKEVQQVIRASTERMTRRVLRLQTKTPLPLPQ